MSKHNPKGKWTQARRFQLQLRAPEMTVDELADWFNEEPDHIRKVCNYYGYEYKRIRRAAGGWVNSQFKSSQQMNAQESIGLFKSQYQNQPINQLITKNWSNYEQKRIN